MSKDEICELVRGWHICEHSKGSIKFNTMVQMPSGSVLFLSVRPAQGRWIVSDRGSAVEEATSAGIDRPVYGLNVRRTIRSNGLAFSDGQIESPPVDIEMLQQACVAVANTSRDIAESLIMVGRDEKEMGLDRRARSLLVSKFHTWVSAAPITVKGESEKAHTFDNALILPDGRKVLIDTVNHHANSINSVVVSNIDVKNLNDETIIQRIVFDPNEPWKNEEIALLKVGAQPVALPKLPKSIEKLAA